MDKITHTPFTLEKDLTPRTGCLDSASNYLRIIGQGRSQRSRSSGQLVGSRPGGLLFGAASIPGAPKTQFRKGLLERLLLNGRNISLLLILGIMILLTGAAGFIGFHVASKLIREGQTLIGLDNFSPSCDTRIKGGRSLKRSRAEELMRLGGDFQMIKGDICDSEHMRALFAKHEFTAVIHLAAMAGVRASVLAPKDFLDCNVSGFSNILECCTRGVEHLVFASSSSVYGGLRELPFKESQAVAKPLSVYAASKRAKELLAYVYASQYDLAVTGLRYFTVYGPWSRPDMALFSFARAIRAAEPIKLYNRGDHRRSFCYVEDAAAMTLAALARPPLSAGRESGGHLPSLARPQYCRP